MSEITPLAAAPPELAPSQIAPEQNSVLRVIGLLGLALGTSGVLIILSNQFIGPRAVGIPWGVVAIVLGMAIALFAALNESDPTVLRAYGFLGFGLLIASGALTLAKPANFSTFAWAGMLIGLGFLICLARREKDQHFHSFVFISILSVGAVCSLVGMGVSAANPEFLINYGLILTILGLIYITAFIGLAGSNTGIGFRVASIAGWAGIGFLASGAVRSLLPYFVGRPFTPYAMPQGFFLIVLGGLFAGFGIGSYSENRTIVMTRRELAAYFYSPIAYLLFLGMLFIGVINFVTFLQSNPEAMVEPIVGGYLMNIVPAFAVIFIVPAITMRLFSEEKRTATFEVLMASPLTEFSVVFSKFLASLIFYMLLWIPFLIFLIPLRIEIGQPFDYRPVIAFLISMTFVGAGFVSMGLFFSSVTKNQIIAAVLTFAGMMFLLLIVLTERYLVLPEILRRVFSRLAFWSSLSQSIQGRIYLRDLIVQASLTVFWLFLTVKSVESRKWS